MLPLLTRGLLTRGRIQSQSDQMAEQFSRCHLFRRGAESDCERL